MVIYTIWNKKRDRYFIGYCPNDKIKSVLIEDKIRLKNRSHSNYKLNCDFIDDGENYFEFLILEITPKNLFKKMNQKIVNDWIKKLKPYYGHRRKN